MILLWNTGSLDLVLNTRTYLQLKSFRGSVYEAAKCVKPGGVFLLVEGDFEWYAEDQVHLQEPNNIQFPDGSWLARFFYGAILSLLSLLPSHECSIRYQSVCG